jgi:hypothetical protein
MRALRAVAYLTNALQVRSLVAGEEACRREFLEIDLGERLRFGVADDEASRRSTRRAGAAGSSVAICGLTASGSARDEWASSPDPQE